MSNKTIVIFLRTNTNKLQMIESGTLKMCSDHFNNVVYRLGLRFVSTCISDSAVTERSSILFATFRLYTCYTLHSILLMLSVQYFPFVSVFFSLSSSSSFCADW